MSWDTNGALIGALRLDPTEAYGDVPGLLERHIKQSDQEAWELIKLKIDYLRVRLGHALRPVLLRDDLEGRIRTEINAGRKLFFKPNVVCALALDYVGDGSPGLTTGVVAVTPWQFMAALLSYFHDELGVRYHQMAVGEAGVTTPMLSTYFGCPPEAILEGRVPRPDGSILWAGYPFYFVRKYLAETTEPLDALDDPLSGYEDSVAGEYVTPGQAGRQGKLVMYELNQAERGDRGRHVHVPDGGDNYPEGIVLHKAMIGDPDDHEHYPGSVLVNCPVLKVHCNAVVTAAVKNLGIGGWPMRAGHDDDPDTHDWLYAFPHADPPGMKGGVPGGPNKGGVYHSRWYVKKVNDEGMPLEIGETPNMGLDGTMVDINLAIRSQVALMLHVMDAVRPIDFEHGGSGIGVARDEGFVFASEDPVAVDLLGARYLFTRAPQDPDAPDAFRRTLPVPRYDEATGAIVGDESVMDDRVSRSRLFDYAARRGLGRTDYHVEGVDETAGGSLPLASHGGRLGRIVDGAFEEVVTKELYYDIPKILWDLQPTVLAHARATDALTKAKLGYDPGYLAEFMALDEDGDGVIDDLESGKDGLWDCQCAGGGITDNLVGNGKTHQGSFFAPSRILKFSDKAWNVDTSGGTGHRVDTMRVCMDTNAFAAAFDMARGEPGTDPFFDIPFGTGPDGIPRWPSLQYARFTVEQAMIRGALYEQAKGYAEETGQAFTVYVPAAVPYFRSASYDGQGIPGLVAISDRETLPDGSPDPGYDPEFASNVFTARFAGGERW